MVYCRMCQMMSAMIWKSVVIYKFWEALFFYEISGVESVKSVYNQIYEIIHKRLQNSKGASFDLVVGNCSDLYCSCFDRFHQH